MQVSSTSTDALWQTAVEAKRAEIATRRRLNAANREFSRALSEAHCLKAAHDLAVAERTKAAFASYQAEGDWEAAYKVCEASAARFVPAEAVAPIIALAAE
jgi:hypothetical protein